MCQSIRERVIDYYLKSTKSDLSIYQLPVTSEKYLELILELNSDKWGGSKSCVSAGHIVNKIAKNLKPNYSIGF